ncbi:molybdopterin-dependent oxidoreductase [Vibrio sp. SS-MA-C1-2]|uniref:DMSO/selenate family reductase complex A subunit n=1 Tax=Vibrio sp. SS-MA-C1-2 TaxID=2908646 RepID=UPI001F368E0B|nr:DMSO/selenate family reductase complex A subunit [Vibrio sp. SS-MA-C1-2]UJF18416.1 molybdopterin-dependent oxidoreductase [Vibrio sp. SS-MA-C1-2]
MSKLPFLNIETSRRKLLDYSSKAAAATTLAASLGSLPLSKKAHAQSVPTDKTEFKHSACLVNCGSRCALKVKVQNDRIIEVEPEDTSDDAVFGQHQIRPCLRGRSNRYRVYNPDRLKYPMKRIGKRGEGKFERITWEEATKTIAEELTRIRKEYGSEAIYNQYGTGAYYHTQGRNAWVRLLALAGGYLNYYNSYSTAQINGVTPYTYGKYVGTHFSEIEDSDLVVLFGLNLSETRMSGGGQVEELRRALEKSGAKVVIIDPRYTDSAIVDDAEWLAIRPTSDAAFVAGLIHTMVKEELINHDEIRKYAVGFTRDTLPASAKTNASYKDYIMGSGDDGIEKTPEWAARITGIPAKRIKQLARQIATAKSAYIAQGWGPQRHHNGEQSVRAIQSLCIISGQFGRAGTNSGNWPYSTKYGVPGLPVATNSVKTAIPVFSWTDAVAHPEKFTQNGFGLRNAEKLSTGIKFMLQQAGNVLANQHGDLNRTREILADESLLEMIVVVDNHMTPTAKFADILLPETTYLEADDLVDNSYASGSNHYMISMEKTITPMWEVRSTYDVCADIAKHLGIEEEFTLGKTQAQWIETNYQTIREKRTYLPEFKDVKGSGIIDQQRAPKSKSVAHSDFYQDPIANPLTTPSGKIEIYSENLQKLADKWTLPTGDKITPIPEFLEVPNSFMDKPQKSKYPLQMTGFHTKGHTHSTYASVSVLAEAVPDEIWINPIDAGLRHIKPGEMVQVFNDYGKILVPAKVTNRVMPGVTAMPQGAWSVVKNGVDIGSCINSLTSHNFSPIAKGNPQHTNLVEIMRA